MQNAALLVAVLERDASARGDVWGVACRVGVRRKHQDDVYSGCWAVIQVDQSDPIPSAQVVGILSWSQGAQEALSGMGR